MKLLCDEDIEKVKELLPFLRKTVRSDIRRQAIEIISSLTTDDDFQIIFNYNNNELLSLLCEIFEVNFNEHRLIYPLLINISSINNDVCECLIDRNIFVTISVSYCRNKNNKSNEVILYAAKLISNFSHFHHDKVYKLIIEQWPSFIVDVIDLLKQIKIDEYVIYLGYTLVNFTRIFYISEEICQNYLSKIMPLIAQSDDLKRRFITLDIIFNILHYQANHETILNNDEYFCGIIEPLMDLSYQFSDNEMEKLPLQLQYYDRTRISDFSLINKLLDIIYKLISTGTGLDCLSRKGIYAVLRELDKSLNHLSQKNILFNEGNFKEYGSKDDWQEERIGNEICKRTVQNENKMKLIDENSDLLHLLIGILINSSENIK